MSPQKDQRDVVLIFGGPNFMFTREKKKSVCIEGSTVISILFTFFWEGVLVVLFKI